MVILAIEKEMQKIYSSHGIVLIYGPAGSGKSLFCLQAIKLIKDLKGKIIYVDCQSSSFPYLRLKQIYGKDIEDVKERIFFVHPRNFYEQAKIIENISKLKKRVDIIIIDNMTYLYRLEKGGYGKSYKISKMLIKQIDTLADMAKNLKIPIIISSHVYSIPKETLKEWSIVGGKILEDKADYKIILLNYESKKKAIIINNTGKKSEYLFNINESGINEA